MSGASTAQVMAEFLKQAGIPFIFGYPGTSNIEFMEAARRRGVYLRPLGDTVYVAPALTIPDADLDALLDAFQAAQIRL